MQKVYSIQSLRALAAFSVLLFHISGEPFTIGAAGVDVFFVISGLIMGSFAATAGPGAFLYHRLVRIVPLYWAVTLVMCVGAMAGVFSTFTFTLEHLWKSLFFIPYAGDNGEVVPLLVVGWTLNLEMFFYIVFALGLALRAPLAVTVGILSAMALAGQVFNWQSPFMQTWTSPLLLEFLGGLLLSRFMFQGMQAGIAALVVSLTGFVAAALISEQSGMLRLMTWGVPAFFLVAGCVWLENAGLWPKRLFKPIEIVGDSSYALYLLHGLVISIVHKILAPGLLAGVVIIIVALTVSVFAHFLFERPLIKLFRRRYGGRPRRQDQAVPVR
ncbi:polysaccharide biosynthesis acyltransferase UppZ [Agrobacterium leguminum]|uniref:polysaccharide biosynthesis acyltransferase UppZ n=1 Tax=Agrobacterium leguminum TaxID=2792015 RepID=UPI0022B80AD0|nr:polysaccharide biosynthesis acyltransferase UppZ [Agrobacterium leguminum]MCZ7934537.1 polysaccharide biosynthesis acyltransferase UppZ [Agrobacterium leguminum]